MVLHSSPLGYGHVCSLKKLCEKCTKPSQMNAMQWKATHLDGQAGQMPVMVVQQVVDHGNGMAKKVSITKSGQERLWHLIVDVCMYIFLGLNSKGNDIVPSRYTEAGQL